jgi:hypothetical protein
MGGWSSMNKVEESFAGRNMNSKSWRIRRTMKQMRMQTVGTHRYDVSGLKKENNTWDFA